VQRAIIDPLNGGKLKDTRTNRRLAKDIVLRKSLELKIPATQSITLSAAIDKFIEQLNVKYWTHFVYKQRLTDFAKAIGPDIPLTSITDEEITKFDKSLRSRIIKRNGKETGLKEITISDYFRDVYSFLKYCKEKEWIKKIPFERRKRVRKIHTVKQVIPLQLMKKLFNEIKSNEKHYRTLKLLAITGLRPIEAVNLTWEQVDFHNNRIIIDNTKVNREDTYPLSGNKYSLHVRKFLWSFKKDSGLVLDYNGKEGLKWINKKLKKIIGNQYTIYDIRRTFCTNLLLGGVDPKTVQILMRHKDIKTTLEHYTFVEAIRVGMSLEKLPEEYWLF
jgi:integrase